MFQVFIASQAKPSQNSENLLFVFGRFFGLSGSSPHSPPLCFASLRALPCNPERGIHGSGFINAGIEILGYDLR
ncbi:MAG: hypothetical protein ACK5B6_02440 [Bacteroidia bacterium]|jgi:hypothetical protein